MLNVAGVRLAEGAPALNHTFQPGRISVVLGRNRSGKTRLCRLLAGLEPLGEGSLQLDGQDIGRLAAGERPVSLVYQTFVNYPNLTVADNIASPLRALKRARRASREHIRVRVKELAVQLGIQELLERYPDQLSGGQQQRVAIARALAKEARVLVLDEPLANLDFKLRESFEVELRSMLQGSDLVVVYTTSDPRDAFNLGAEVLLLDDHALVQAGAPLEVYQAPRGSVAADLMSDPGINCWYRDSVLHAVRPEHLDLRTPAADDLAFSGELQAVETNGSETYLHCRVEGEHWVARIEGLLVGQRLPRAGEHVELVGAADSVVRFPGEARLG